MSTRSRARQVVVQVLFQNDLNPDADDQQQKFIRTRLQKRSALVDFANALIIGVRQNQEQLDAALQAAANNWSVPRMAVTDRSILRLATYELLHTDTPPSVVINEAIELAKRFGSNQSAGFVNGILDRVRKGNLGEGTESSPDELAAEEPSSDWAE
jgi:N utilization substance protein B